MKTHLSLAMISALLITAPIEAGPLVNQYFPMNNGDSRFYRINYDTGYTATEVFRQTSYNGHNVFALNFHDEWDGYPYAIETWYFGNNAGVLAVYGIETGWGNLPLNSAANILTDQVLANGGSITSRSKGTLYGVTVDVTFTTKVTSITGPVTVPAGTFYNCKQVLIMENATAYGQNLGAYDSAAWILAPGVGIIKDGLAIWDYLTQQWIFQSPFGGDLPYLELVSTTYKPPVVAAPVFTPPPGPFSTSLTVRASTFTVGATIRYTINGMEPTLASTIFPAPGVVLRSTTTLKAKAFKTGINDSPTTTGVYTQTDLQGPVLTITSPTNNAKPTGPNVPRLTVSGTATDNGHGNNGISSVTVNGVVATGGNTSGTSKASWSATITLTPGQNTITVIARDAQNNLSQKSLLVTCTFGTMVGSFNGVQAFSNGSVNNNSGVRNSTGLEWQCVEYVNRYYSVVYGMNLAAIGQDAFQFFDNAENLGLEPHPNGGSDVPQVGDILCFKGGTNGKGHVAIIRSVSATAIYAIQQNLKKDSDCNSFKYPMSVVSGKYTIKNSTLGTTYTCQGWMRKPGPQALLLASPETGDIHSSVSLHADLVKNSDPTAQPVFRMHFVGNHGGLCILQSSSDLIEWHEVGTFTGSNAGVDLEQPFDSNAGSYFFRVVVPNRPLTQ